MNIFILDPVYIFLFVYQRYKSFYQMRLYYCNASIFSFIDIHTNIAVEITVICKLEILLVTLNQGSQRIMNSSIFIENIIESSSYTKATYSFPINTHMSVVLWLSYPLASKYDLSKFHQLWLL